MRQRRPQRLATIASCTSNKLLNLLYFEFQFLQNWRRSQAQGSLPQPEGDCGGEGVGGAVVAHGDAAPVLEAAKYDPHAMPLAVELSVA